ncbi:hypothetical protein [Pseudomonas sp. 2FE]|uniref:hypothetical protein n=1 Tax=Pseudomonas sp. 2FE TaxID=2502190 RepID=UPI0010F7D917|nr:hypothetical protein [Pseudomonas sp. 2FE]
MQKLNALTAAVRRVIPSFSTLAAAGFGTLALSTGASAADLDLTTMIATVSGAAVIAAFLGMGIVKLGPNFARWAINKVASFF